MNPFVCLAFAVLSPAAVREAIQPLMAGYAIPGVAVGVVDRSKMAVYNFGVASRVTRAPVSDQTLFEIGSISKTFTAALAADAAVRGKLSLDDPVTTYLPALRGSGFDRVRVADLATHTAGGLPLQVPEAIGGEAALMTYYSHWTPIYPPGTCRMYSNVSIGLLGLAAAAASGSEFSDLMQSRLLAPLGLTHTYLRLPAGVERDYAQGYTATDRPIRVASGFLAAEAYGIRTTAADLLRYLQANMGMLPLEAPTQGALLATRTGYYRVGPMTQDLVWEQYPYPVTLADLLAGNAPAMASEPHAAAALCPILPPQKDVWVNKTGSTNGFAAYVAFVPGEQTGVVLLTNKNIPIDARVRAVWQIFHALRR